MNYLVYIILLIITLYILYNTLNIKENFTVYQINYKTKITPWNDGPTQYRRCICSGLDDCRCLGEPDFDDITEYPSCYIY